MRWVFAIILILCFSIVSADPPEQVNIKGFVRDSEGTGIPNGWVVHINNTDLGYYVTTEVYAPPVPQLAGAYSAVSLGDVGNLFRVWTYNETSYGLSYQVLTSTTQEINVSINESRDSETVVHIIDPANNALIQLDGFINLTVNVSVLGASGTNCVVSLQFTNNIFSTESFADLGSISLGSTEQAVFNLTPTDSGSTDIVANASCQSDGIIFKNKFFDILLNITVGDNAPPIITLITPLDNNITKISNDIVFFYNVSDNSNISNCSLYINGTVNDTIFFVEKDVDQNFSTNLGNGFWNWGVGCFDIEGNYNVTTNRSINVSVFFPKINTFLIPDPIMLTPTINTSINCSFIVTDYNGQNEIVDVNSTFSTYGTSNNYNNYYTNNSCDYQIISGVSRNYTCNYNLVNYAVNGTWFCNATAIDEEYHSSLNSTNTTVLPLFSFDVEESFTYGNVEAGATTQEVTLNVTNTGNINFSLYLWGFGGFENSTGYNKSFHCLGNNITLPYHKYSDLSGAYGGKTGLESDVVYSGIDVSKAINYTNAITRTYWQLQIPGTDPVIELGTCNGTVVFEAFMLS